MERKEKTNGKLAKVHVKLWKYEYMVKKDQPKLKQVLGLDQNCTYEDLFYALEFDERGEECDLEGYDILRMTDEWVEQGMNTVQYKNIFTT